LEKVSYLNTSDYLILDCILEYVTQSEASHKDPFLFYSIAATSFLETTVATYVDNLFPFFKDRSEILNWLSDVWLPEEAEHGYLTRRYINDVWPAFDWEKAYGLFFRRY
jgi:hypothetical protein